MEENILINYCVLSYELINYDIRQLAAGEKSK